MKWVLDKGMKWQSPSAAATRGVVQRVVASIVCFATCAQPSATTTLRKMKMKMGKHHYYLSIPCVVHCSAEFGVLFFWISCCSFC